MARPETVQSKWLMPIRKAIQELVASVAFGGTGVNVELAVLEVLASRLSGIPSDKFIATVGGCYTKVHSEVERKIGLIEDVVNQLPFSPAIAIAALAEQDVCVLYKKQKGAFYTDFRIAEYIGRQLPSNMFGRYALTDPACGAGILLAASICEVAGNSSSRRRELLSECVFGWDLDSLAVYSARVALGSLCCDWPTLNALVQNIQVRDALLDDLGEWKKNIQGKKIVIVSNPPWERLRQTVFDDENIRSKNPIYGGDLVGDRQWLDSRRRKESGSAIRVQLDEKYPEAAIGERDLYAYFVALYHRLVQQDGGIIHAILPGSVLRSESARMLRKVLLECYSDVEVLLLDNGAKFFSIDSRFKFLILRAAYMDGGKRPIAWVSSKCDERVLEGCGSVKLGRRSVAALSKSMTIPEIRSRADWLLLRKLSGMFPVLGSSESSWGIEFRRELDMTLDRDRFSRRLGKKSVPVLEGRHIHQFQYAVKSYVRGQGRGSVWLNEGFFNRKVGAQFFVNRAKLKDREKAWLGEERIGFCDIAGQTNERTMLASEIPVGVLCGNKVPVVGFRGLASRRKRLAWLGIVNSFAFDWLLRRNVTTTINYFVLRDMPFPKWDTSDQHLRLIARLVEKISPVGRDGTPSIEQYAHVRAEVDSEVSLLFGLSVSDVEIILSDFPQIDKKQPPLPGESKSTITRDLILWKFALRCQGDRDEAEWYRNRVVGATNVGAVAYCPNSLADCWNNCLVIRDLDPTMRRRKNPGRP